MQITPYGLTQRRRPQFRASPRSFFSQVRFVQVAVPTFLFFQVRCAYRLVGVHPRPKFKIGEDMLRTNTCNHAKFHRCRPNGVREKHYQKFVTPKSTKYPTILPCGGIITQHAYINTGSTYISSEIFTNCFAAHHIISLSPTSVRTHNLQHGNLMHY